MTPIDIHHVLFRPDDRVEITYAEKREQTESIAIIRTIIVERRNFSDVADILSLLEDLVDDALLAVRNPPDSQPLRKS